MYITEMKVVMKLTPEDYENRGRLVREFIKLKKDGSFKRVGVKSQFQMPRFTFDANYNAYYCTLRFERT